MTLMFMTLSSFCMATEFYVAPDGNDAAAGTIESPLATLQGARDKIRDIRVDTTSTASANELTLAAWVYPDVEGGYIGILSSSGSYFALNIVGTGSGHKVDFRADNKSLYSTDNIVPVGSWSHLVGVWKRGQIHKVYVNGSLAATNSSPSSAVINPDVWYIATDRLLINRYFNGQTKGVHVWTRALSESEIASMEGDDTLIPSTPLYSQQSVTEYSGNSHYDVLNFNQMPSDNINVYFREGRYYFDTTVSMSLEVSGEAGNPITYKPYNEEKVIFDGSVPVDVSGFAIVTDGVILDRLHSSAAGKVYRKVITDSTLQNALSSSTTQLELDGKMMQLTRFPNLGYAHIETILDAGAIYAHGRTPGDPPTYDMDNPIGGEFTIRENDCSKWQTEYQRTKKAKATGYFSYDWYKYTHAIASIQDGVVKLLEYSRYGVQETGNAPRRLYVTNLLCELDQAGEWYYDDLENALYLWPYGDTLDPASVLGVWNGPPMLNIDADYITLENITVQGVARGNASGDGMININSGTGNKVAGCTLRNSSRPAMVIRGGTNNGIIGSDVYDVASHVTIDGGILSPDEITPCGNYAINCHFTQVGAKDFNGGCQVRGVGAIFRNNLIHNMIKGPVTPGSCDQIIEKNEIFNVGFEEGDWAPMYWGQKWWSYGNVFRYNFIHHIMSTPGLHPRAGLYADQGDAGDKMIANIFYKCAARSILMNGGAGHHVESNVLLDGYWGIYQTGGYGQDWYDDKALYDSGQLTRGDVTDFVWRTEQVVGPEGWNDEPWLSKYPLFATVMNEPYYRFFPIYNTIINNMFYGNTSQDIWLNNVSAEVQNTWTMSNNHTIRLDAFVDVENMDFTFVEPIPSGAQPIPFDEIGLYIGDYRTKMPDKNRYRTMVKDFFAGQESYDPSAVYNPDTINQLIYYNTGRLIMEMKPVGDLNEDGLVNLEDFSKLARGWLETTPVDPLGAYAYWPFEETSGTDVLDLSGNGYNGTMQGGVTRVTGRSGNAVSFDGSSGKIAIPALDFNSNTITITAWIKREGLQDNATPLLYTRGGSTPDAGLILTDDGRLWGRWNGPWETNLQTPDGQWAFAAFVVEPGNLTMYLYDGTILQTESTSGTYIAEEFDGTAYLGWDSNYPTSRYLTGQLDDVRVYNSSLTSQEIDTIYQNTSWSHSAADIHFDGVIDLLDLRYLAENWLAN